MLRISLICFSENEETFSAAEALKVDRRMGRCKVASMNGGMKGAIAFLAEHDSPTLLVIEVSETGEALFAQLEELSEVCDPEVDLVLLGRDDNINLYKQLIGMGLKDYYCGAVDSNIIYHIADDIYAEESDQNLGRVISFFGSRGGVGSSSIALNTAYALGQLYEEKVVLVDLDLAFGSNELACNLQQRQNVSDALAEPNRLDDVMLESYLLKYNDHLSIFAAPSQLTGSGNVDLAAFEILLKLIRKIGAFVILDIPHQWNRWVHEILLDSDEVIVSTYPDLVNLKDTKNIFDNIAADRRVDAPTRMIFNSVGKYKKGELSVKDFETAMSHEPAITLPYLPNVFGEALTSGVVLAQAGKSKKIVAEFDKLAAIVGGRIASTKKKRSRFSLSKKK